MGRRKKITCTWNSSLPCCDLEGPIEKVRQSLEDFYTAFTLEYPEAKDICLVWRSPYWDETCPELYIDFSRYENAEEYKERQAEEAKEAEEKRQRRYKEYQKLKKEFESG